MSVIYHPQFCETNKTAEAEATPRTLSVVICTKGRAQDLRLCLEALRAQTWHPNEIIVVDTTKDNDRIAEICADTYAIHLKQNPMGLDRARNVGAATANSDVVAFLGEDSIPRLDWVCQVLLAFERSEIDIVTGCVRAGSLHSFAQIMFARYWAVRCGVRQKDYTYADFLGSQHGVFPAWDINCGSNFAVRRSSFARFGLFDPALDIAVPSGAGESEFTYRVLGQGGVCRYTPDMVVWRHYVDSEDALQPMLRDITKGHVAALRIQAQRFPGRGNWRRILVSMPLHFLKRIWSRVRWGRDQRNWFLFTELKGYFDGLFCSLGGKRQRLK